MRISDWSSDVCSSDLVALTQRTVFVHEELGHDEQRDALDAIGRVGGLREHQVDDIVGQVMLARRDEDLGAGDRMAAVAVRHRAGTDQDRKSTRLNSSHYCASRMTSSA